MPPPVCKSSRSEFSPGKHFFFDLIIIISNLGREGVPAFVPATPDFPEGSFSERGVPAPRDEDADVFAPRRRTSEPLTFQIREIRGEIFRSPRSRGRHAFFGALPSSGRGKRIAFSPQVLPTRTSLHVCAPSNFSAGAAPKSV